MKSTTGQYYQALDHVRALAAFTVFVWHFNHFNDNQFSAPLMFPLSFFTEGHTGVAIFMTLSGYLFAKLLDGKSIAYGPFLWNRALRLLPLLFLVLCLVALKQYFTGGLDPHFLQSLVAGIIRPTLPNGGWSITVEFHFYVVLPLLLIVARHNRNLLLIFLPIFILIRIALYQQAGEIQSLAYWTIIGRIDQFLLGILAFQYRSFFVKRHLLAALTAVCFLLVWYVFDQIGGFYKIQSYPSPSPIWIILPTIEGWCFATLIAWYDNSFVSRRHGHFSNFIAKIGNYSFSIYLFHFFIVFDLPVLIDKYLFDLSNPYLLLLMAIPSFLLILPFSYLSYRYIEAPFLKLRVKYIRASNNTHRVAPFRAPVSVK